MHCGRLVEDLGRTDPVSMNRNSAVCMKHYYCHQSMNNPCNYYSGSGNHNPATAGRAAAVAADVDIVVVAVDGNDGGSCCGLEHFDDGNRCFHRQLWLLESEVCCWSRMLSCTHCTGNSLHPLLLCHCHYTWNSNYCCPCLKNLQSVLTYVVQVVY